MTPDIPEMWISKEDFFVQFKVFNTGKNLCQTLSIDLSLSKIHSKVKLIDTFYLDQIKWDSMNDNLS